MRENKEQHRPAAGRHRGRGAGAGAALLVLALGCLQPASSLAQQCAPIPPPTCAIDSQFLNGRWALSGISGSYTVSGQETYQADATFDEVDPEFLIDAQVSGSLQVEQVGGPEENYLEVACDGTVTGRASERISGRLLKTAIDPHICGPQGFDDPDMDWDLSIERSYRIEGEVSGPGELTVEFIAESAETSIDGYFVQEEDCFWTSWSDQLTAFDITGNEEAESVRLSGGYDPVGFTFNPDVEHLGDPWLKQIANRLQVYFQPRPDFSGPDVDPPPQDLLLHPADWSPPAFHEQLELLLQEVVEITPDLRFESGPKTPVVTAIELTEPSTYLNDVTVTTQAIATIDWRAAEGARSVDFTYGGTTETVAASGDTATFDFDAGEPGASIVAVARAGGEESQSFSLRVGKTSLPAWAGSPGDWSGSAGVIYDGQVNWPVSLQTTRTVSALSLFAGVFGIEGSASSEYNARAQSNGSPLGGDLTANASFKFAGKGASLSMVGNTQTTLSCGELSTEGSASVTVPPANWQKTLNPITLIPGVNAAACSISGLLCQLINSVGVKARAYGGLGGTADYQADSGPLRFTGGSLNGTLGGSVSASAVPRPLSSVAQITISGGAGGCIEVEVPPEFMISKLGGELTATASMSLLGFGTSVEETIPFGDPCGGSAPAAIGAGRAAGSSAWVPANGGLAIALLPDEVPGDLAVAAWSEPRPGEPRPAGDLWLRIHDNGAWGAILPLSDDVFADLAPTLALVDERTVLVVNMRNEGAIPATLAGVDAWAAGFDLQYRLIDIPTATVLQSGLLGGPGFDFGPQLVRDRQGGLHLFWQSASGAATGVELMGTDAAPAALHHQRFDGAWGPAETVASGLSGTFGWQAAAFDADTQALALVLDTDQNLGTEADREIALIERTAAGWAAPRWLGIDAVPDQAPSVAFEGDGRLQILWRRGSEAWTADAAGVPTLAFVSNDQPFDDGIGSGFAAARLISGPAGAAVIWPDAHQLTISRRLAEDGPTADWAPPQGIAADASVQSVLAARSNTEQLQLAWTRQAFNADGITLDAWVTPVISSLPFGSCAGVAACEGLFADGFE